MITLKKPSGGFTKDQLVNVLGKKLKVDVSSKRILKKHHLE